MDPKVVALFREKGVMYVTLLSVKGPGVTVSQAFPNMDREGVERELKEGGVVEWWWRKDGGLCTIRRGPGVRICQGFFLVLFLLLNIRTLTYPFNTETNQEVWSNHAHLFHPSDLPPSVLSALLSRSLPPCSCPSSSSLSFCPFCFSLPKTAFFGDGTEIPPEVLDHVREAIEEEEVGWEWLEGDVLVLDNLLIAHGRNSFTGPR